MENEITRMEQQTVKEVSLPLFGSKGWIKFLGVLMIIYGVFMAMTLVGIVIAWLPIWLGVLLNQTANQVGLVHLTGDKVSLIKAQNSLSTYFTIYGVLALIGIILTVLFFIVVLSTGMLSHLHELQDMMNESYY